MFGKKKEVRKRANSGKGLSQYGLFDIPGENDFDDIENMDDDDDDLEAELLAITSGKTPRKPKKAAKPPPVVPNLDLMVAQSLKDIPSDEELSGDENDPELLEELSALQEDEGEEEKAPIPETVKSTPAEVSLATMLEERLKMYQEAEKNAKAAGETSRARRFGRGIKTLNDLLKQARTGRNVNEADIPPPVSTAAGKRPDPPSTSAASMPEEPSSPPEPAADVLVPTRPAPVPDIPMPTRPAPPPPSQPAAAEESPVEPDGQSETLQLLKDNQSQYKQAAVKAKRAGDTELALQYVKIAKQFDVVIAALLEGKPVDLSSMPPPPSEIAAVISGRSGQKEDAEKQQSSEPSGSEEPATAAAPEAQPETGADVDIFQAPPPPATVMEALEQRLAKYRSVEQAAKDEGNSSKARRMGRIVKQYEGAIKLHRAGKPIPVDELPTPPGFAPIPVDGASSSIPTPVASPAAPSPKPAAPEPPSTDETAPKPVPTTSPKTPTVPPEKVNVRKTPQSRQEKQLSFLLARQKEFREAAIEAKQKGEINQAKEYLRLAKGFDPLIEASKSGLPVDMDTLPVPPGTRVVLESDFDFITVDDCIPGSDAEIFEKLEEDLLKQAKMCLTTRDHFKAIGDIASANRFEKLAIHSKKDLDAVRVAHKRSEPLPKFHYEMRNFSIVQCCTDLTDNELELIIMQGINYNVPNPKEVDTYVKFEFPYPTEDPPKDRTSLVKDTNNPEYNATFNLPIQRNVRACQRVFKRHSIKLEVWSRGFCLHAWFCSPCSCGGASSDKSTKKRRGFFRGDSLIGTANVKLLPLETKCEIHDSFDLMDGRKPVGGKLEVKVRIRNPILTKQVEQIQEKWLVIDGF